MARSSTINTVTVMHECDTGHVNIDKLQESCK